MGGRGVHRGKKKTNNHSKEIRLAEKAELSWQACPAVAEQVCRQSIPAKGRSLVARQAKEKCAGPSPTSPACPFAIWEMDAWTGARAQGVRPQRRMSCDQHGFSEVQPGCLYGRCYRHACLLVDQYTPEPDHFMHYTHTPCSEAHPTFAEQFLCTPEHLEDGQSGCRHLFLCSQVTQM